MRILKWFRREAILIFIMLCRSCVKNNADFGIHCRPSTYFSLGDAASFRAGIDATPRHRLVVLEMFSPPKPRYLVCTLEIGNRNRRILQEGSFSALTNGL